ncbi:hypothetical protein MTO96_031108 [Rhipicephalus appendiculatus]
MADSSCPAFFKRASSPVSLPISHLGPILRHPGSSPPAIERPSRMVATWTVLGPAVHPVVWTSGLSWELQPRTIIDDPPLETQEPF